MMKRNRKSRQHQHPNMHAEVCDWLGSDVHALLNSMHGTGSIAESPKRIKIRSLESVDLASPLVDEIPNRLPLEDCVYRCSLCHYKTEARSTASKHLSRHLHYCQYVCGHCGERFEKAKLCLQHHDLKHNELMVNIENDEDEEVCQFVSLVLDAMRTTLVNNDQSDSPLIVGNSWKCTYNGCLVKTQSLKALLEHFTCHVRRLLFCCGMCTFSDNSKSALESHCQLAHKQQMRVGEGNPEAGTDKGMSLEDDLMDTGNAGCASHCPFCNYQNQLAGNVTRHALGHYDFRFYFCPHCGMECLEPSDVENHIKCEHANLQVVVKKIEKPDTLKVCNEQPWSPKGFGQQFVCSLCKYKTTDPSCIRLHCQNDHDPLSIFLCHGLNTDNEEQEVDDSSAPGVTATEVETSVVGQKVLGYPSQDKMDVRHFCIYCAHVANSLFDLELHWQSRHENLPFISCVPKPVYRCPECKFTSSTFELVRKHVVQHLKRYVCERCERPVYTFKEGVQHSKSVHPGVAVLLMPCPEGTECMLNNLMNDITVVPDLSLQAGGWGSDGLDMWLAKSSGKVAKKQHRSINAPANKAKRSSASK